MQIAQKCIGIKSSIEQKTLNSCLQENPKLNFWFFLEVLEKGPDLPQGLEVPSAYRSGGRHGVVSAWAPVWSTGLRATPVAVAAHRLWDTRRFRLCVR